MSDLREMAQRSIAQGAEVRYDQSGAPYLAYVTVSDGVELAVDAYLAESNLTHEAHAIGKGGRRLDLADELAALFRTLRAL